MKRRNFIKTTGLVAAGAGLAASATAGNLLNTSKNKLPRWKGFNLLDYFSPRAGGSRSMTTDEDLKWMADWGFDFVRLPMAYPRYVHYDPSKDITPDDIALWNFRGDFGILDSGRKDIAYEDWHGHKLDRKLLTLLMKY